MIAPRVTNHLPPFWGNFFPDLQGASSSYHEQKSQASALDHGFWFISCLELSCCCLFALLPCYELLALSNHIIISGLLLFWRSGGVRSLGIVGGSSKVR